MQMANPIVDDLLVRNWGVVALRGLAALLFGLLTLFYPALTLAALILIFGAYAIADGLFTIAAAVRDRRGQPHWVALLVNGVLSIAVGVLTFVYPGVTALVLLYFIAAWALVGGIAQIATAIRLRKVITGEWMLILAGILSVLFGVVLVLVPGAGALAVTLWIGTYATVFGILLIVLALRLRSFGKQRRPGEEEPLRPA
jgi:uncharacterized membrane protein HdeD (DUF308 family)